MPRDFWSLIWGNHDLKFEALTRVNISYIKRLKELIPLRSQHPFGVNETVKHNFGDLVLFCQPADSSLFLCQVRQLRDLLPVEEAWLFSACQKIHENSTLEEHVMQFGNVMQCAMHVLMRFANVWQPDPFRSRVTRAGICECSRAVWILPEHCEATGCCKFQGDKLQQEIR